MLRRGISALISLTIVLALATLIAMVALTSIHEGFELSKPREERCSKYVDIECRKVLDRGYVCVFRASRDLGTARLYLANESSLEIEVSRGVWVEVFASRPLFLLVCGEVVRIDYG